MADYAAAYPQKPQPEFVVNVGNVENEARFYRDADRVDDHLDNFRRRLLAQNKEFDLLLQYYMQHRGHLDVYHRSAYGKAPQPNLGRPDPSWYYMDERGNKIWVQHLSLEGAIANSYMPQGAKTGAFSEACNEDGRVIVVKVPPVKRQYSLAEDYYQKCVDLDASLAMSSKRRNTSGGGASLRGSAHSAHRFGAASADDEYIAAQMEFADAIAKEAHHPSEFVARPPVNLSEAEVRMRQLKAEEAALEAQLAQIAAARSVL